jgi:hypothetical protein
MTTMASSDYVQDLVRQHVASEIVCEALPNQSGRVGCIMPLQYAHNADSVVVYVEAWGDRFRVSDGGEAFLDAVIRKRRDETDLLAEAAVICRPFGVDVTQGVLVAQANQHDLGDAVWRTATAAIVVAQTAAGFRRARRQHDDHRFTAEVEQELRQRRRLPVQRDFKVEGSSGHTHRATLWVPTVHAIVEPIHAPAHYNQIASVYTKFGDLSHANGYRRLALVDDRGDGLSDDLAAMLVQVSDVVDWTRREQWLEALQG